MVQNNHKSRLYSLDYLRGLAALFIMIYHYCSWTFGAYKDSTFLGRIGIYGVSIFYVLSGLTLYHVYFLKMKPSTSQIIDFFIKRLFRIFPLLWLVTILTCFVKESFPIKALILNLSGAFSVLSWDGYIGTGVWSIGNELVFYLFFPVFIFLSKQNRKFFLLLGVSIFFVQLYFCFFKIKPTISLADQLQWHNYTNPLNQIFLFLGGYLIGYFFHSLNPQKGLCVIIGLVSVILFAFIPTNTNTVFGINRLIFTALAFGICFAFYKGTFLLPGVVDKALRLLGEFSYSMYLLHPLVWFVTNKLFKSDNTELIWAKLCLSIFLTLIISYLVYVSFEKYFMKQGRKLSNKLLYDNEQVMQPTL
ncbi:acyltransferase [Danxiaibacter flavus]|uniref:Acyltransferase n=1 Tax=Danxiaibacter flavus TaxID=3049108 RepID=A0ABV3ZEY3_9BACT|nr:acyltransferase [Chitinophagaceae bacterium DXS]